MAKIGYTKLDCKINTKTEIVVFNDQEIEVKQYLPIDDKLKLIGRVIDIAHDEDYNYSNPVKRKVYTDLEILMSYTNIAFTDKMKENVPKLYDAIYSSGLLDAVFLAIPRTELKCIYQGVEQTMTGIYQYQHSAVGILDLLKEDYSAIDEEAASIQAKLRDPENLSLVKDILTKLG